MKKKLLTLDTVLKVLRKRKNEFNEKYGVTTLGVFGSVARDRATTGSDVDIVVQMEKPDLFFMVHIKEELEHEYGSHVDIIQYRESMNPLLKRRIDKEAVYV